MVCKVRTSCISASFCKSDFTVGDQIKFWIWKFWQLMKCKISSSLLSSASTLMKSFFDPRTECGQNELTKANFSFQNEFFLLACFIAIWTQLEETQLQMCHWSFDLVDPVDKIHFLQFLWVHICLFNINFSQYEDKFSQVAMSNKPGRKGISPLIIFHSGKIKLYLFFFNWSQCPIWEQCLILQNKSPVQWKIKDNGSWEENMWPCDRRNSMSGKCKVQRF